MYIKKYFSNMKIKRSYFWGIVFICLVLLSACSDKKNGDNDVIREPSTTEQAFEEIILKTEEVSNIEKMFQILDDKYVVKDKNSNLYGIYDFKNEHYILNPYYDEITAPPGIISPEFYRVKKNNMYGCIDKDGNEVIGLYFNLMDYFYNGNCIVNVGGKYGLINESGSYIVGPQYTEMSRLTDYLFTVYVEGEGMGALDAQGNVVINISHREIFYKNNYVFASAKNVPGNPYEPDDWYEVFREDGTPIFTTCCSKRDDLDSIEPGGIVMCVGKPDDFSNIYRAVYKGSDGEHNKYGHKSTVWCGFLDYNFKPLNNEHYDTVGEFISGYAAASYFLNPIDDTNILRTKWVLVNENGTEVYEFNDVIPGSVPKSNGYLVEYRSNTNELYNKQIALNLKTSEKKEYDNVEFFDGTACTIVKEQETELYGLYDGYDLVRECVYNSIEFLDNDDDIARFRLKRGAEEEIYESTKGKNKVDTISSDISSTASLQQKVDYLLPESNVRYLTKEDISGFSKEQLRLARNEIFARHGYIFKSDDLRKYFESKSWYIPSISADEFNDRVKISDIEKANSELLKEFENK